MLGTTNKIITLNTPGSKKFLVVWERIANAGIFLVNAETAKEAIDYVGYSDEFVKKTAVEVIGEPVVRGKMN